MTENVTIEMCQELVEEGLTRTGLSSHQASMLATGKRDAISAIRRGKMPSVDRWAAICHVLGIPFHTGFDADLSASEIVAAWWLMNDGHLRAVDAIPAIPAYVPDQMWYVIEVGEQTSFLDRGDLLFFSAQDPLSGLGERLIGRWCLVELCESGSVSTWSFGRCRRSDDGNPQHINLESATGQATQTNLKPLQCVPLRLVAPRV